MPDEKDQREWTLLAAPGVEDDSEDELEDAGDLEDEELEQHEDIEEEGE